MMKPYLAIMLGLLLVFQGSLLSAQEDKGILKPNEALSFKMPSGGSHQFSLPVKKDVFSGGAWFFGQAEFVRDDAGAIAGCKVSSGRVRNVYFQKMNN